MGRVEDGLRGIQPIGNDGAPAVNQLQEQGPLPPERAGLNDLADELSPQMSTAERQRLSAEIFGASQEHIRQSELIVAQVLNEEAVAKYPQLAGQSGPQIGAFLENLKATNPTEHRQLIDEVAAKTIVAYREAGIDPESLGVLWQQALSSTTNGLQAAGSDLAQMSTQGMLATALMGGGTFLLTGSPGWALGVGGLTAVMQSDEATDFLTEQAMPAVGRTAVQGIGAIAKMAALPGHALNHIINGQPMEIANDLSRFTSVDLNNALRAILGGETLPNGDNRVLVEAMRELMTNDIAVAPAQLQPILTIILSGTPAQKAALSQDQFEDALDFLIQARDLEITRVDHIRLIQKRFRGEDLSMPERQQLMLAQSRSVIEGYLRSHPNFDYEAMVNGRFSALSSANGGQVPTLTLDQALPPSAALGSHDFSMPPSQINSFLQTKGIELPKHGTEWLLWAYMMMTILTPIASGVGSLFRKSESTNASNTPEEPEVRERQVTALSSAVSGGRTPALMAALVSSGIIASAHREEIETAMNQSNSGAFDPNHFDDFGNLLDTERKTEALAEAFFKDFESAYSNAPIQASRQYMKNKTEVAKINNFWSTASEGANATMDLVGANNGTQAGSGNTLPNELKSVTIAPFSRLRRLRSVGTPQSYFRTLNGLRGSVTYLPIVGGDDQVYLLKITDTGSGFTVNRSAQTWNPARKAAEVARESFTDSAIPVSSINFSGGA